MKPLSIQSAVRSIRTQFGLVTGCTLLGLLLAFYLGGRYILVQMIREAEHNIQTVGNDIKNIVYGEMTHLQDLAFETAAQIAKNGGELPPGFLQGRLHGADTSLPVNLSLIVTADGTFENGYASIPGEPLYKVETNDILAYFSPISPIFAAIRDGKNMPGVIIFHRQPMFFAAAPVRTPDGQLKRVVILGSLFHNSGLMNRITAVTPGMQVALADKQRRAAASSTIAVPEKAHATPIFSDVLTYYSGGRWHLGENTFEAVMPVSDIFGQEVSTISIRLPGSFSSLASIALGWLTSFIACVGIVFVLPIFWLQTRIVLNPLSKLTRQIRDIGEHHLNGDHVALSWPKKDEFGILAQSVNEMLRALAAKTRQNLQGEQHQRALIAGMPDCLCICDLSANIVTIHKQPDYAHPIPGLIAGRSISPPLFPDTDCEAFRAAVHEAFRANRIQMVMLSCRETDGSYRHFETRISRMDETIALVVLRDVTKEWRERETREQVEDRLAKVQKMESLGTLAAGIAHDVNNILAIIQNTVEMTWEKPTDEEREALGTIRQATRKGAALTRELMTYAGHTRINFKREDPNSVILELEKLMNGVIAPNVILDLNLAPGLPYVNIDPHQFWKVIINLLKNASEAMNGSSGRIRISTYPFTLSDENAVDFFSTHPLTYGHGVVFQVDDTGSGIPKDVLNRIFEPFFSTKAVGRGLGLATVFGIVDVHNGGIAISSEPGKGTTFRVWVPATKDQSAQLPPSAEAVQDGKRDAPPGPAAEAPVAAASLKSAVCSRVLLIEDDRSILQSTTILLRSLKVETLAAASKREALALFRQHADSIGLILMDAQIGSLDNVRLLTAFRLRKPGVPTVIISGHSEERIRAMFASESYDGFLSKPYTRNELKTFLTQYIGVK